MQDLNVKQKQYLKGLAHNLDPVVMIGDKGLTSNVIKEIDTSLSAHELIKIRVFGDDRDFRTRIIEEIGDKTGAQLVQHIGKLLVFYRQSDKKKITIPNK